MNLFIRTCIIAVGALFAGACVSLLPETTPAKPRYHIASVDPASLSGGEVNWSLVIDDPRATRVYDTVKIAVSTAPGKVEYYAGAEWADRAPRLLQTAIVQSFEDSGRILAVGDRSALPLGDVTLQTDIREIQLDVHGGSFAATAKVYARLTDGKGSVHAARLFVSTAPASSNAADDVTSSFNTAFDRLIADIVQWSLDQGEVVQS